MLSLTELRPSPIFIGALRPEVIWDSVDRSLGLLGQALPEAQVHPGLLPQAEPRRLLPRNTAVNPGMLQFSLQTAM